MLDSLDYMHVYIGKNYPIVAYQGFYLEKNENYIYSTIVNPVEPMDLTTNLWCFFACHILVSFAEKVVIKTSTF